MSDTEHEPIMEPSTDVEVDADEAELLDLVNNKNSAAIRCCDKCNRYLKRTWRGSICSKCQYKNKYHNKIIRNIKKNFVESKNPFVEANNVDFNTKSDNYIKTLYKLLDMYFNPSDDREKLITRLNYYKNLINDTK